MKLSLNIIEEKYDEEKGKKCLDEHNWEEKNDKNEKDGE